MIGTVVGRQVPTFELVADGEDVYGAAALRLSSLAGLELDPWQEHVLRRSMLRTGPKWAASEVGLVVPRQQGKGTILEARELVGLFAIKDERTIIHSAHLFRTAQEAFSRVLSLIRSRPELEAKVARVSTANGAEGIETKDGSRLLFMARSASSGRGFTGDLIILDEAFALTQSQMAAMLPTMAAKSLHGNPQVWYTSSAGMVSSDVLGSVRSRARRGAGERLTYFEWSADFDADIQDDAVIASANPGLGIRMSMEHVKTERAAMAEGEFKRERLGIWAEVGTDMVFGNGVWEAAIDEESCPGEQIVFAVDVSPNRDSASIVAVSRRDDDHVHCEVIQSDVGTAWVGYRLNELGLKWKGQSVIVAVAGSQAESLLPSWKRDGADVKLLRFGEYVNACGNLYDMVMQGVFAHLGDPLLTDAVKSAQRAWNKDMASWYWSRKASDADITPLVAATVGVAGLEHRIRTVRAVFR